MNNKKISELSDDEKNLLKMYPDFEKNFPYPKDLEAKIKKTLENLEIKAKV